MPQVGSPSDSSSLPACSFFAAILIQVARPRLVRNKPAVDIRFTPLPEGNGDQNV